VLTISSTRKLATSTTLLPMPAAPRPPLVVMDTTVIRADLRLAGATWDRVFALARRGALQLHIPQLVVLEAIRHYARQTALAEKDVRTAWAKLARFGIDLDPKYQAEALEKLAQGAVDYRTTLTAKLAAANASILRCPRYPTTSS
jgi:predicted nucleic acid-binding protein